MLQLLQAAIQLRTFPTQNLVKIPDDISDDIAAAIMLKGMTAEYLIKEHIKLSQAKQFCSMLQLEGG